MTRLVVYWSVFLRLDSGSKSTGAESASETLGVLCLCRGRGRGRGGRTKGGACLFNLFSCWHHSFFFPPFFVSFAICSESCFIIRFTLPRHLCVVRRAARCRRREMDPCLPQSLKSPPWTTPPLLLVSWAQRTFRLLVWSHTSSVLIVACGRGNKWN